MSALFLNVGEVVLSYVAFFFLFLLSLSLLLFRKQVSRERISGTKRLNLKEVYIYIHTLKEQSQEPFCSSFSLSLHSAARAAGEPLTTTFPSSQSDQRTGDTACSSPHPSWHGVSATTTKEFHS